MKPAQTDIFKGIEDATIRPDSDPGPETPYLRAYIEGEPVSAVFNGTYTITNRETGEYRTFRIRTQGEDSSFAPGKRVLSLLTGSDNTTDYKGFAFVTDEGAVLVWRKLRSQVGQPLTAWEGYQSLIIWTIIKKLPRALAKYEVLEDCRCIRCNRKLTTPESIKAGIGPICAGRL